MMSVERLVLKSGAAGRVEEEHLARYRFAASRVAGHRVLDCASGSGYGSKMLLEGGAAAVVGVDVSPDAVASAKAVYGGVDRLSYAVADAQSLEAFPDASFSVVVSFETIEHVPDDRRYLDAIHRVLKPGGKFFVSTPDFRLGSIAQRLTGRLRNPFHVREYTGDELLALLATKFRIDAVYGQALVSRWRLRLPVELVTKIACHKLLGERGRRYVDSAYYPRDSEVVPMTGRRDAIPSYWVVECTKLS